MLPLKYILAVRSEERSDGNGLSMGQILWCLRFVAGDRNSDHGNLSGGGAPVSGCVFADCMRLRLLQALRKESHHEYCCLEISQGIAWYFAEIISRERISFSGSS